GFYWADVRAPGLPILMTPTAWFGATDQAIRAGVLVSAVAGVGLTWLEARLLLDRAAAIIAAVLLALSPGWFGTAWRLLPDIPGTTLVLASVVVLTLATQHERMRWWAVAVAPIAAVATAVRYGTPLLLGPALVAVVAVRWRAAIRAPVVLTLTTLLTAGATAAVWLIPEVTGSRQSPVLIFRDRQVAKAVPMLDSTLDFVGKIPVLVGPIVGTAIVVGIAAALVAARRRQVPAAPVVACLAVALTCLGLLLLGVAVYQVRYLTPTLPFLAIAAGAGLAWVGARVPGRTVVTVVTVAAVVAVAVGAVLALRTATVTADRLERRYGPTRTAASNLSDVAPDSCYVLSSLPQQTQWYSWCGASYLPVLPIGGGRSRQTGISDAQLMAERLRSVFSRRLATHGIDDGAPVYVMLKRGSISMSRGEARALLLDLSRWKIAGARGRAPITIGYLGTAGELAERADTIAPPGGRT
ncbi:MAG TPA: glycosyltransferase family 39 protein, partial [Euzebyales bacterium]|nr:glycosyltransferase family 39 protein [Euzebyales bacterium]